MATVWTSHLKGKEKENFEGYIRNSVTIFERLNQILEDKTQKNKEEDYQKASWAYYQAHQNGYNQAIEEIQKLINFALDK